MILFPLVYTEHFHHVIGDRKRKVTWLSALGWFNSQALFGLFGRFRNLDGPEFPSRSDHSSPSNSPVVLVNSDLVDTLRVERLPFPHPNFSDMGDFGSGAGLLSRPCIPSNGGACSSAPTQRSPALGQAAEADCRGSILLGMLGDNLAGLAFCPDHCQSGDGHRLALKGIPPLLDVEIASFPSWSS